jgi:hypothetical protein
VASRADAAGGGEKGEVERERAVMASRADTAGGGEEGEVERERTVVASRADAAGGGEEERSRAAVYMGAARGGISEALVLGSKGCGHRRRYR